MILLYFVAAILIAVALARYNESNRLFWVLFVSFMLGLGAGSLFLRNIGHKESKVVTTQVCPTQALVQALDVYIPLASDLCITTDAINIADPASKDYTFVESSNNLALSKDRVATRDQPPGKLFRPPQGNQPEYIDDS